MTISRCRFAVEHRRRSKAGDERQLWVGLSRSLPDGRITGIRDGPPSRTQETPPLRDALIQIQASPCKQATGRWNGDELVLSKAVEALPMKLRIGNRAAFLAHTRLAECRVSFEQTLVAFALHYVALRRPGW